MVNFLIFIVALLVVYKSADSALKYSSSIAESLGLSKGTIGFMLIAFVSVLPETFISALSAFEGNPAMGLGTLFGSNIADLTLIFAIVAWTAGRDLKVQSQVIKNIGLYMGLLGLAIALGMNGYYSRWEGALLVLCGLSFHLRLLKTEHLNHFNVDVRFTLKNMLAFMISMACLLLGAHFTVGSAVDIATTLDIKPALVGMFLIALGTTLPELFFSIKAAKKNEDSLALGDILGTVLTDATIVVGILALIHPFHFDERIVYSSGAVMFLAAGVLFYLMKTEKKLTRKEALLLVLIYIGFTVLEWNL